MSDYRKSFPRQVRDDFSRWIAQHPDYVVRQEHRDGDTVRLWRCGVPGSSTLMFYVCAAPHCLMVYGDMGEFMWQRHEDMIPFVRGSGRNLSYFAEKVPPGITIRNDVPELVDEWLLTIKDRWIERGGDWGDQEEDALEELQDEWNANQDSHQLMVVFSQSVLHQDCDDYPHITFYTYHYLWIVEGLQWFIQQLDGGHVVQRWSITSPMQLLTDSAE